MTNPPTRETVEALLALLPDPDYVEQLARNIGDWSEADAGNVIESLRDLTAGIRPLAEAYLATLDARREGEREALRRIRDFCESMSCDLTWKRAITEIDRRLAEGEKT